MKAVVFALIVTVCFAVVSNAQTVSLNPISDAFVSASNPGSNYGGAGALAVSGTGSNNGEFDSVLQFNLASAAGLDIQSVTLQLTAASPINPIFNSSAAGNFTVMWMANDSWTEGTGMPNSPTSTGITYSTLPTYLSGSDEVLGTYAFTGATSGSSNYTLNLTPNFLADVTAGGDVSFEIIPAASSSVSYLFNSRSFGTTTARPLLTVVAVPEPGSPTLAIAGLLTLAVYRRSRRSKT